MLIPERSGVIARINVTSLRLEQTTALVQDGRMIPSAETDVK
jgi:hypothetical protein